MDKDFKMNKVLNFREALLMKAEVALSEIARLIDIEENNLRNEIIILGNLKKKKINSQKLTIRDLKLYDVVFTHSNDNILEIEGKLNKLGELRKVEFEKYINAKRDVLVIEKLKEKHEKEYKKYLDKKEENDTIQPFISFKYSGKGSNVL